jgi:uridine kinase
VIIGVAGGTGSGKTTVARTLAAALGSDDVVVIQHDSYYRDRSPLPFEERQAINYDHPESLETSLLVSHLHQLIAGRAVEVPVYDFSTHSRRPETWRAEPRRVIVVEGILIFVDRELRDLFDCRLFVDTDDDVRFIRRLERDVAERGRTMRSVIQQYLESVKPMHLEFVEPSKRYADLIIPEGGRNAIAVDVILAKINALISGAGAFPSRHQPVGARR